MTSSLFTKLAENYPFITLCRHGNDEYVGIIQNQDDSFTTLYDFGVIVDLDLKKQYLQLATQWWEESNRQVPINIFLKKDWDPFKDYIRTFTNKDLVILHGPCTSLSNLIKKTKRKSVTLVRRMP